MDPYELRMKILEQNRNKLKLISKILLLLLIIILIMNMYAHTEMDIFLNTQKLLYIMSYILLITVCISIMSFSNSPHEKYKENNLQRGQFQIRIFTFLLLFFSAFQSFFINFNIINKMIYPIIIILCFALLIFSRKDIYFIILTNSGFFIVLKILLRDFDRYYAQQIIFVILLTLIGIIISTVNYKSFRSFYMTQLKIANENEQISKLAKELQIANRQLEQLATIDSLTNLPNRLAYSHFIEHLYHLIKEKPMRLTTLMIDIDSFKQYNDHYGHLKGDTILKKIAAIFRDVGHEYKVFIARWGGEEFVALFVNATDEQVEEFCGKISKEIRDCQIPHEHSPVSNYVTISIGAWLQWVNDETDIDIAMSMADTVLYEVKNNGRNHYLIKSQT